jgi:hypothetical protein
MMTSLKSLIDAITDNDFKRLSRIIKDTRLNIDSRDQVIFLTLSLIGLIRLQSQLIYTSELC